MEKTKRALGWPVEPAFLVPKEARDHFSDIRTRGAKAHEKWEESFRNYAQKYPELAVEFKRVLNRELPSGWSADLPLFNADDKEMATREASGKILNVLAKRLPELMGGDADLAPSTHTLIVRKRQLRTFESRRKELEIRSPRARHGRNTERDGAAPRLYPIRFDLFDFQ